MNKTDIGCFYCAKWIKNTSMDVLGNKKSTLALLKVLKIMNMKRIFLFFTAALLLTGGLLFSGCGGNYSGASNEAMDTVEEAEAGYLGTIDDYLVKELGPEYLQGEICIPYAYILSANEDNLEDILVWGDFWVFQYNLAGDTLKMVSGGDHPGLLHLRQTADSYEVTAFDAVEDGSSFEPTAREIFGVKYDLLMSSLGNQEAREDARLYMTAEYVREHGLKATMLQDYGWPAVALPLE